MLSFRQALVVVPAVIFAFAACDAIGDPIPLQVSVAARPDALAPRDTTRIDVTIRNLGPRAVTFNSNCTISFQVRPVGDTTDVANPGPIFCLAFIREVTLGPFESYTSGFQWNAMRRSCNGTTCVAVPVPAGAYRLTGSLYDLVSPAVPLTVR
jgi:hypothetical protein